MHTILSIGHDENLLNTRSAVLRTTQSNVTSVGVQGALDLLNRNQYDLILFCHEMTEREMTTMSRAAFRHSSTRILKLVPVGVSQTDLKLDEVAASPDRLLHQVKEILDHDALGSTARKKPVASR